MTGPAMVTLAMTTKTAVATTASDVESPSWASPVAAPAVRIRFLGLTPANKSPSPKALAGDSASTPAIHFGMAGSSPGAGRFAQFLRASASSATPRTILPHDTESDAVLLVATLPSCATTYTTVLTAATASTQPTRKASPFTLARREKSIRITAMIGTGLMATPMANVRTSLIPCPMWAPSRTVVSCVAPDLVRRRRVSVPGRPGQQAGVEEELEERVAGWGRNPDPGPFRHEEGAQLGPQPRVVDGVRGADAREGILVVLAGKSMERVATIAPEVTLLG